MPARNDAAAVLTANGLKGHLSPIETEGGERAGLVRVTLESGRELWVAPDLLIPQPEGHYLLPVAVADQARSAGGGGETTVIPVVEEQATVHKRAVDTGGVRVSKVVHERDEVVDTTSVREEVDVQREPVATFVDAPEPARQDGDRLILPIYEEVVVVEKRLRLKERWVITRRRVETPHTETVRLREEDALVERLPPASGPANDSPPGGP